MNNLLRENKGVTLLALVITIIIIMILLVVTMNTLTGDNGLLTESHNIKNNIIEDQALSDDEIRSLKDVSGNLQDIVDNISTGNAEDDLAPVIVLERDNPDTWEATETSITLKPKITEQGSGVKKITYAISTGAKYITYDASETTHTFTGLHGSTEYFVAVEVEDNKGNKTNKGYIEEILGPSGEPQISLKTETDGNALNEYTFNYTGDYQTFTIRESGNYQLEVWGAMGGYRAYTSEAGKGAYAKGILNITDDMLNAAPNQRITLYVYVGGRGNSGKKDANNVYSGGYNGGGYRYGYPGGGGATDIRLIAGDWNNSTSLLSRIILIKNAWSPDFRPRIPPSLLKLNHSIFLKSLKMRSRRFSL